MTDMTVNIPVIAFVQTPHPIFDRSSHPVLRLSSSAKLTATASSFFGHSRTYDSIIAINDVAQLQLQHEKIQASYLNQLEAKVIPPLNFSEPLRASTLHHFTSSGTTSYLNKLEREKAYHVSADLITPAKYLNSSIEKVDIPNTVPKNLSSYMDGLEYSTRDSYSKANVVASNTSNIRKAGSYLDDMKAKFVVVEENRNLVVDEIDSEENMPVAPISYEQVSLLSDNGNSYLVHLEKTRAPITSQFSNTLSNSNYLDSLDASRTATGSPTSTSTSVRTNDGSYLSNLESSSKIAVTAPPSPSEPPSSSSSSALSLVKPDGVPVPRYAGAEMDNYVGVTFSNLMLLGFPLGLAPLLHYFFQNPVSWAEATRIAHEAGPFAVFIFMAVACLRYALHLDDNRQFQAEQGNCTAKASLMDDLRSDVFTD